MGTFIRAILHLPQPFPPFPLPDYVNMTFPFHIRLPHIWKLGLKPGLQVQPNIPQYQSGSLSHRWD